MNIGTLGGLSPTQFPSDLPDVISIGKTGRVVWTRGKTRSEVEMGPEIMKKIWNVLQGKDPKDK